MTPPSAQLPDDLVLIARINAGSEEAFEVLYLRHRDWVFRMACRWTGGPQLADDIVQEVFCYFLGKFPGFVLTSKLRTFFYPVVRNLSLSAIKKARRHDGGSTEAEFLQLVDPGQGPGHTGRIDELVGGLNDGQRELLLLRYVDGMTVPEIAETLAIPLGTAKSRLHHAIEALRGQPAVREIQKCTERSSA